MRQPPIIVTKTDYERIDALLEKTGDRVPGIRELRAGLGRAHVVASDEISANVVMMNPSSRSNTSTAASVSNSLPCMPRM